jgi:hypothetical protein
MKAILPILLTSAIALGQPLLPKPSAPSPTPTEEPQLKPEEVIFQAEAAALYLQKAIEEHTFREPSFRPHKQQPEDRLPDPPTLLHRDGRLTLDWTPTQHARFLMERLRQGLHAVQSAERSWTIDILALESARAAWPQMRDMFCAENPEVVYYDPDGFKHYCPAK